MAENDVFPVSVPCPGATNPCAGVAIVNPDPVLEPESDGPPQAPQADTTLAIESILHPGRTPNLLKQLWCIGQPFILH